MIVRRSLVRAHPVYTAVASSLHDQLFVNTGTKEYCGSCGHERVIGEVSVYPSFLCTCLTPPETTCYDPGALWSTSSDWSVSSVVSSRRSSALGSDGHRLLYLEKRLTKQRDGLVMFARCFMHFGGILCPRRPPGRS